MHPEERSCSRLSHRPGLSLSLAVGIRTAQWGFLWGGAPAARADPCRGTRVKTQGLRARTCPAHRAPATERSKAWRENSQGEWQGRTGAGPLPRSSAPSHPSGSTGSSTGRAAALPHLPSPGQIKGKAGVQGQNHIRGTAEGAGREPR